MHNCSLCIHVSVYVSVLFFCQFSISFDLFCLFLSLAQIRDIAYGSKTYVFKPNITDGQEAEEETLDLNRGDNLLEVQIVGATLSPPSLEMLGDHEPSTFCTYAFYLFELHSTPVVTGHNPKYGFTSKYVVNMDDRFLDYVHRCSVTVEMHQALGLDWRTVASAQLPLQQLLEHDGKVHGSAPLFGRCDYIITHLLVEQVLTFMW